MMRSFRLHLLAPLAFTAVACLPLAAQTKPVSDAKIEADVLKAFAADSRVANQPINTSTVYGTVTLSGSVSTEAARDAAEQIASRTPGVKKVVDQLSVGAPQAAENDDPSAINSLPAQSAPSQGAYPEAQNALPGSYGQPYGAQPGYGQQPYGQGYPTNAGTYPQTAGTYPEQQGAYGDPQGGVYPPPPPPPQRRLYRRDYERQMATGQQGGYGQPYPQQRYAPLGQPGGQVVTVPNGTVLPVSINRWLSSGDAEPGSGFTAIVANDILAGGQIAIPRGATVEGTVLDAKGSGVLKGRGFLTLQLNTLDLGGNRIPLQSEPFTVEGHDKAAHSVASTAIGAGLGALFGAAIGRGTGAAIGAGVGGAAGLGTAAASNSGQATLRPEELLRFRLIAPTQVTTVSEAEMQRLGGYAGPAGRGEPGPYGAGPYTRPYPVTVGIYAAPYPYPYYRRGFYRGYWY